MKPVHLNRQLVLEAPTLVPDNAGGYTQGWIALGTLWAEVSARTGREKAGEASQVSTVGYRIIVRGAPVGAEARPAPEQRFREGQRLYRIQAVAERDPNGRYLTCFCNEEVAA